MKGYRNLSFVIRIGLAMTLSLFLNLGMGYFVRNQLSQPGYVLSVEADYFAPGTMELHFDSGNNFNADQGAAAKVSKGANSLIFPFNLKEGQQLKFLRLDFGQDPRVSEVRIRSISLSAQENVLFELDGKQIATKIGLLQGVEQVDKTAVLKINTSNRPFDPYIVFSPVNELIYPLWKRTMLLIAPWILLFLFPILKWVKKRFEKNEVELLLAAFFLASIPLKIAWVTFTSLLLLAYALVEFTKTRHFRVGQGHWVVLSLFAVPLFFLGAGEFSKLAIPLGFVLFPLIFSTVDFSGHLDEIKKTYTKVFLVLISITIVSWVLLMCFDGYFYKLDLSNYFTDIKSNAHAVMYWLYYPHTTFLSFFILIGGIFCYGLYADRKITKTYGLLYALFALAAILILGSRFAWGLAILLPVLFLIPVRRSKKVLLPLWAVLFLSIVYFIDKLDVLRTELWQISVTEIKKNLWFGHGTGNSDLVLPDHLSIANNGNEALIGINHSHNQFLTYLIENGLLGAAIFICLMIFIFYLFAKRHNKTMMLVTFAILLIMVVESPFKTATPLYLFSFLWCLHMSNVGDKEEVLADNL